MDRVFRTGLHQEAFWSRRSDTILGRAVQTVRYYYRTERGVHCAWCVPVGRFRWRVSAR